MRRKNEISKTLIKIVSLFTLSSFICSIVVPEELQVARVSPAGDDVPRRASIVIEFSKDIVALGDSLFNVEDVPITIVPAVKCEWNWVKRNALTCNLSDRSVLKLATEYTVTINPGITTEAGETLTKPYVHKFGTKRPTIYNVRVVAWAAPTIPILEVSFDQSVYWNSIKDKIKLRTGSIGQTDSVVWSYEYYQNRAFQNEYFGIDRIRVTNDEVASRSWFVLPHRGLKGGQDISVLQLPGVRSTAGNLSHEQEQSYPSVSRTFSEFRFLGIVCFDLRDNEIKKVTKVQNIPLVLCAPDRNVSLLFSTPLKPKTLKSLIVSNPQMASAFPSPAWSRNPYFHFRTAEHTQQVAYKMPQPLQPNTTYELRFGEIDEAVESGMPPFHDVFGREIRGIKRINIQTGHYQPRVDLNPWFSVVELDTNPTIPVISRNVDTLNVEYVSLDGRGAHENQLRTLNIPKDDNTLLVQDLGLRQVLNGSSGAMLGFIRATPRFEVAHGSVEQSFFSQATPYQVYFKEGAVNTLVWVTDMRSGKPVEGARVELYLALPKHFAIAPSNALTTTTDETGLAKLAGKLRYNADQEASRYGMYLDCDEPECRVIWVKVTGERGIAVLPINAYTELALPRDANEKRRTYRWYADDLIRLVGWGTTSQGVYHKGDTVRFKGYVRDWSDTHLQFPPNGRYSLHIRGPDWNVVYSQETIELNEFGAFEGEFKLSKAATMGEYLFELSYEHTRTNEWDPQAQGIPELTIETDIHFFVSDFTPNPIRVSQVIHGEEFQFNDPFRVTTTSEFHAGGAFRDAKTRVTVWIEPQQISFNTDTTKEFRFNHSDRQNWANLLDRDTTSDKNGNSASSISRLQSNVYYGTLAVESAVQTDRGKFVTARSSVRYRGVDRYIGLLSPDHRILRAGEPSTIETLVVSKDGKPKEGAPYEVRVYKQVLVYLGSPSSSPRASYSRNYQSRWELVHRCSGESAAQVSLCTFTSETPGRYLVEASVQDTNGNFHKSDLSLWVISSELVHWKDGTNDDNNFLQMSCVESELQVGEHVRCVVENPLPNAPALITIERTGVIDQFVQWFDTGNPVIEFEVKPDYMPGFFLSVIVASPRVKDSRPNMADPDWVDTGIPSYQIGNASFDVTDPGRDLMIEVKPNRTKFEPRDKVSLTITTDRNDRKSLPVEYAVIVLDEAVLDLITARTSYFDPSDAFDHFGNLGVTNYSLIHNLVGFGTREESSDEMEEMEEIVTTGTYMPVSDPTVLQVVGRELTDEFRTIERFVAYWNPSVVAENGRAKLSFKLPDNLTSWRVLVLAASSDNRFGFAQTSIVATKDTEIRPMIPNVVSENDTFEVGVSIFNRAERKRTLDVKLIATGLLADPRGAELIETISLAPYERKTVSYSLQAGSLSFTADHSNTNEKIELVARAGDSVDRDSLYVDIPVRAARVKVTSVDYGILDEGITRIPFTTPPLLQNTTGSVSVDISTQDLGSLEGVFEYASSYPYSCWEQKIFRAVIALQVKSLESHTKHQNTNWIEPEEIISSVLDSASDYQAPNGGMAFFVPSDEYVSAYLSAFTALAFSWFEKSGYELNSMVVERLHEYLREVLKESESFALGNSSAQATIRAIALHALSSSGNLSPADFLRHTNELQSMNLFGLAHLLMASINVDNAETITEQAFESIMNRRTLVDGSVEFVENLPTIYNLILSSPARSNCVVLEALSRYSQVAPERVERDELFPLTRSIMSFRGNRSRWSNTQENVYCVNALMTYTDYFEEETNLVSSINLENSDGSMVTIASGLQLGSAVKSHRLVHSLASMVAETRGDIAIERNGTGNGFYTVELSYFVDADTEMTRLSGFELNREYLVKRDGEWRRLDATEKVVHGDIITVNLFLNVPSTRYHVVVDDTVPGGIEPVSRILDTDSLVDLRGENRLSSNSAWFSEFKNARGNPWPFYHTEKGHANVRFFAERVRPGKYRLSWVGQAISSGEFHVVPAHVEEMYRPEIFGKSTSRVLQINR